MKRFENTGEQNDSDDLQLVSLKWICQKAGDPSETATRRWLERMRAKGILVPVALPGRRLRYRKVDAVAILSGKGLPN
jgi:hypothetical protein